MNKKPKWEKEFDKFAGVSYDDELEYFGWSEDGVNVPPPKEFKQFIRNLIKQKQAEAIKNLCPETLGVALRAAEEAIKELKENNERK